ncbi:protein toll [Patella vulgata]|uniref:protein toll n=1 Tax=Patella vulgata TaxID=6465 RepID=UPI00218019D7|nr:protein toll [Patella vulgata]
MGDPTRHYLIVLIIIITSCTGSFATDYFPTSWSSVCKSDINNTTETSQFILRCALGPNDPVLIDLKQLKSFTTNLPGLTVNVSIECSAGGNLSMTWPMKIPGLSVLKIQGCVIYDFINDWNNQELEGTPDTLQSLTLVDSGILINFALFFESFTGIINVSREWNCGHDTTLRRIVIRSFKAGLDMTDTEPNRIMEPWLMEQFVTDIENMGSNCRFEHLEYLEESAEDVVNAFQVRLMTSDSHYPNLKYLNFSNSQWQEIPPVLNDFNLKYPKLEYIDFSSNFISKVTLRNLATYDKNRVLDVRNNNITTLAVQDIKDWVKGLPFMFVDIRNNPLDCSCIKREFIYQVQDEDWFVGDLFKYKYIRNMTCATPPSARGKMLQHLTEDDMGCAIPPADLTVALVIVAIVAVILIILIILSVRYRKEIKILLYTRFGILMPCEKSDKFESKKYAAFVSYSSANGDWVHNYLQENIETPSDSNCHAFKLCLHERDFIGGKSILDNITYSIDNSRHTIVILSNAFLDSRWGTEEFTQAYNESIGEKRRHLILVKLEEIPEHKMPTSLKRCLKFFTYLDVKDKMFLDRLRYSLAIKSQLVRHNSSVSIKSQVSTDSGCVDDLNISEKDNDRSHDTALDIDEVSTQI